MWQGCLHRSLGFSGAQARFVPQKSGSNTTKKQDEKEMVIYSPLSYDPGVFSEEKICT